MVKWRMTEDDIAPKLPSEKVAPVSAPPIPLASLLELNLMKKGKSSMPKSLPTNFQLKSAPKSKLFENTPKDLLTLEMETPAKLMRMVDTLRYHNPIAAERKELNLCGATERLSLHTLNDVLLSTIIPFFMLFYRF